MSDSEVVLLERRIRKGEDAWRELGVALARHGLPPRRVWRVHRWIKDVNDAEDVMDPSFASEEDAKKFLLRIVCERDWEKWEIGCSCCGGYCQEHDHDQGCPPPGHPLHPVHEPLVFYPEGDPGRGRLFLSWAEVVPPGSVALTRCLFIHDPPLARVCGLPANHA